ncbi:MAG: rhomboid family intramembrane serine protease [Pseudomonadota bacterium]
MFVPIHDENSLKHVPFQYVTVLLIAANVAVFLLQQSGMSFCQLASFAIIPVELLGVGVFNNGSCAAAGAVQIPENLTVVSYMFFHGGWMHLIGNMLFLWVFGDNVEDAVGHLKFLLFFILCGVFAGLLHTFVMSESARPLVGASGGVAGVIAAYLMLHPRVQVWVLALRFIPLRISAAIALGLWIGLQFVMALMPDGTPVAWWAHIGGIIAGAVLILVMRRPGVPLFDRNESRG